MRTHRALLAFGLLAGICSVSQAFAGVAAKGAVPQFDFLHVGPAGGPMNLPVIVDSGNRSVLLRGVSVVGLRDDYVDNATPLVPQYSVDPSEFDNGQCPQPGPGFTQLAVCQLDAAQLRSFGYDAVRLAVSWSLLEPTPGVIDQRYVERIAQVVGWLKGAGIYTVIDLHQDAWSKYVYTRPGQVCNPPFNPVSGAHEADGAPEWASQYDLPACMLDGIRDLDPAEEQAFSHFWLDQPAPDGVGLQEHFTRVVVTLARRFHDEASVAGYELFNEPDPGFEGEPRNVDLNYSFPFYARVIQAVLNEVPGFSQLFFIEPSGWHNLSLQRIEFVPWSSFSAYPNVVYSPHMYEGDIQALFPFLPPQLTLPNGYRHAAEDARTLGLPIWVGEFGNAIPLDDTELRKSYELADQYAIGNEVWQWKGLTPASNLGCYCIMAGLDPNDVTTFPSRLKYSSRAYPVYLAGTLQGLRYDPDGGHFELRANAAAVARGDDRHATLLYVPAAVSGVVWASGARLKVLPRGDGSRDVFVYPKGGDYRVHG